MIISLVNDTDDQNNMISQAHIPNPYRGLHDFKTHPKVHKIIVTSNMYRNNELLMSNCSCLYCRVVYQLTEMYNVQQYQINSIDHMNLRYVLYLTAGQNSSVLYGTRICKRIVYQSLYFDETAEMRATRLLYRKLMF